MAQDATSSDGAAPHRTPAERAARGKAARRGAPRSSHAEFAPPAGRRDPLEILGAQSATRVPELVPIRYSRMAESPFRFFRGGAAIMAADLATTPDSGIRAQLCGDAHLLNFGLFASPERRLLFDVNDFDETLPGPWEWDVKRLAASLAVAGRTNGFTDRERAGIVRAAVRSYRESMIRFAGMCNLDVWYARTDEDRLRAVAAQQLPKRGRRNLARAVARARTRDSLQAFDKLTEVAGGRLRIAADPPLLVPLADLFPDAGGEEMMARFRKLIAGYGRSLPSDRRFLLADFRLVDVARKVVGVGSVGTRCWIVLLLGRDGGDPLVLQAKEAGASVLAPYAGPSSYRNQGERVVAGQRLMQAASDIFLGWQRVAGIDGGRRDFYVRQLRDWKGDVDPESMVPDGMRTLGEVCGSTLARAHARSGDRIAIAAYLGRGDPFDRAVEQFSESYADVNERDHRTLADAVRAGRLPASEPAGDRL
ncbi:DUF2252 domain-containing protein [Streptomyces sp. NPDC058231]|uniref:DUF2252 domain-containing protein n=1 Tax=Streptomyces sp. NPDC058231 TaxID=3346392 RepID=UPI0036E5E946